MNHAGEKTRGIRVPKSLLDRSEAVAAAPERESPGDRGESAGSRCDVFLSYSHEDAEPATSIDRSLQHLIPGIRVFYDKKTLAPGASWLTEIADSLDSARRVVAVYTPTYWARKYCEDELSAAYVRQADTGDSILYPIYLRSARIPYT